MDVTISAGGSKMSFETDVLEGVKNRQNYGLASAGIPDFQKIRAGEEEAVLAMYYGENGVGAVPAEELLEGQAPDADYTYLYTVKFSR